MSKIIACLSGGVGNQMFQYAAAKQLAFSHKLDLVIDNWSGFVKIAKQSGFKSMDAYAWGLVRPMIVQRKGLHTSAEKPQLSDSELQIFLKAVKMDVFLNRILPKRCFGSMSIVCQK